MLRDKFRPRPSAGSVVAVLCGAPGGLLLGGFFGHFSDNLPIQIVLVGCGVALYGAYCWRMGSLEGASSAYKDCKESLEEKTNE